MSARYRTLAWLAAWFALGPLAAHSASAAPPLLPTAAREAPAHADALRAQLVALARAPSVAGLLAAEALMDKLSATLDSYFHAPNLATPAARPAALALRPWVGRELAAADGLWVVGADDVMRFRAHVHDPLAAAAVRLKRWRSARRHAEAALRVGGETPARQALLVAALRGLGLSAQADALAAQPVGPAP